MIHLLSESFYQTSLPLLFFPLLLELPRFSLLSLLQQICSKLHPKWRRQRLWTSQPHDTPVSSAGPQAANLSVLTQKTSRLLRGLMELPERSQLFPNHLFSSLSHPSSVLSPARVSSNSKTHYGQVMQVSVLRK